jgi:2-methylcitrate dehydratase PrpD
MDHLPTDLDRRSVLRGTSGVVSSLALLGSAFAEEAEPTFDAEGVPEEARNVEAGLSSFVAKWEALGPVITQERFGRYFSGTVINCHVTDTPRAYHITFSPDAGATLSTGRNPAAHATLVADRDDWIDILYGEYTGVAPGLDGRTYAPKSELNYASIFALVLTIFAHLPASPAANPDFNAETLFQGLQRGGIPSCEGEPTGRPTTNEERLEETLVGENDAPPVTETLAKRVDEIDYADIPDDVIEVARAQVKNVLGPMYAATTLPPGERFTAAVEDFGGGQEATAIAGNRTFRTSAERAAMTNSFLAQMLEWDDFTWFAHCGVAVVPTALAAAELADASGEEFLAAVVLGNEIAGRTGFFLSDPTNLGQSLPVHQTELPFVAGKLLGLDVDALRDASGIAGVQPQLTAVPTWTADVKGLISGDPAQVSLRAARFADAGLSGRRDHLENTGGYWYRVSDIWNPQHLQFAYEGLGERWFLSESYFNKRYPTVGFFQTAVHAALDVREQLLEAGVDPTNPERIEEIRLRMNPSMTATATLFSEGDSAFIRERVANEDRPDWGYTTLLFDGIYPVVAALLEGELTHRQYTRETYTDETLLTLYDRVEAAFDASVGEFGAAVTVITDEETYEGEIGGPGLFSRAGRYDDFVACIRGEMNEDFTADRKFRRTAGDVLSERRVDRILAAIDDLESFESMRAFTSRL